MVCTILEYNFGVGEMGLNGFFLFTRFSKINQRRGIKI